MNIKGSLIISYKWWDTGKKYGVHRVFAHGKII